MDRHHVVPTIIRKGAAGTDSIQIGWLMDNFQM